MDKAKAIKKVGGKTKGVSIKWKIYLFLLGFCVLLLVILWLFQTVFLDSFYTSIKLTQVEKEAAQLAQLIEDGDMSTFESNIRARGDLMVELVNEDGTSYVVDGFFPEMGMWTLDEAQKMALYEETRANGGSLSRQYDAQDLAQQEGGPWQQAPREDVPPQEIPEELVPDQHRGGGDYKGAQGVLHTKIVTTPGGQEYMLLVRAAVTPVSATVQTLRVQLWLITAIMLLLAVGIALLIAQRVAKPIEKLNASAAKLGRGEYDVRFEATGYREITELSATLDKAARELAKTEGLRRELLANVSHDLRTPLTLIGGYAEMMRDIPGENNPDNMQVIIDETQRLSALVEDMLDLSRLQSGTAEMRREAFDLTGEIEAIMDRFSKLSGAEGYTLRFDNQSGHVWVQADSVRITQVVYNFLINAMTHGGSRKSIVLRQSVEEGRVKVEVIDEGAGMQEDQLAHIWDRYYRAGEQHQREQTSTGLGLSIVKEILRQHPGAEYGVVSAPGQGSNFWFSLPVAEENSE